MRGTPIWCIVRRDTDWRPLHCRRYRSTMIAARELLLGFTNIPEECAPAVAEERRRAIENPATGQVEMTPGPPPLRREYPV